MYEEKKKNIRKEKNRKNKYQKKNIERKFPKFEISNDSILKKIEWKRLGIKLGILFFVMLLLIFVVSRLNKYQENENETFNKNIERITKATAEYYKSNPLPKNIGDSVSLVIKEMIEIKLIDEIKNNQEKTCNQENSYIIVTKIATEEFDLKIYLECPDKKKVVEKKIVCKEANCTIKK